MLVIRLVLDTASATETQRYVGQRTPYDETYLRFSCDKLLSSLGLADANWLHIIDV
jgi:hypothetical protein